MSAKLAAISIDLDEVSRYAAVHGVQASLGVAADTVYDRCVPRLRSWLRAESIKATFFAVGEDLEREQNRRLIGCLHDDGHEIGNHSYSHPYDLVRLDQLAMRDEIERASHAIARACGTRPLGFRAPGYTVSDGLLQVLQSSDLVYDSSVFPCASYYVAKAAALAVIRIRGTKSASILGAPSVLRAPRRPYRVGRPYWKPGKGMLELPIGVTPLQLPYIGTTLVLCGAGGARRLTRQMLGEPLINLELHGFDVADLDKDGLDVLAPHRPDLRLRSEAKLGALHDAVKIIRDAGYTIVTLAEVAHHWNASP